MLGGALDGREELLDVVEADVGVDSRKGEDQIVLGNVHARAEFA